MLLLVSGIGIAAYFHAAAGPSATERTPVVRASLGSLDAPGNTPEAGNPGAVVTLPPAGSGSAAELLSKPASVAPAAKPAPHGHTAAAMTRAHKRRIVAPPPPPRRPEPELLAAGAPAPVEQPRVSPSVE